MTVELLLMRLPPQLCPVEEKTTTENFLQGICSCHILCSLGQSVTHFCALNNNVTDPPPHITKPPDTDLLSVALLAEPVSNDNFVLKPLTIPPV